MMGVAAGCYVAFGGFLALSVGGQCPGIAATNPGLQKMIFGAFGFPFGLMMVRSSSTPGLGSCHTAGIASYGGVVSKP